MLTRLTSVFALITALSAAQSNAATIRYEMTGTLFDTRTFTFSDGTISNITSTPLVRFDGTSLSDLTYTEPFNLSWVFDTDNPDVISPTTETLTRATYEGELFSSVRLTIGPAEAPIINVAIEGDDKYLENSIIENDTDPARSDTYSLSSNVFNNFAVAETQDEFQFRTITASFTDKIQFGPPNAPDLPWLTNLEFFQPNLDSFQGARIMGLTVRNFNTGFLSSIAGEIESVDVVVPEPSSISLLFIASWFATLRARKS